AEAAFLTGVERNCDVVTMSAYAPLLAHVDGWQWRPDLVWYDNLNVYLTPNYHVQRLFSVNRGDHTVASELVDERAVPSPGGRVGVGTIAAAAEFRDVRVTRAGETLLESDSLKSDDDVQRTRGRWQVQQGQITQSDAEATGEAFFGDPLWRDYTLALRARRTAGADALVVRVRYGAGGSYLRWLIGGWNNSKHALEACVGTHEEEHPLLSEKGGSIQTGQWYDVRVELEGERVRCYLDDQLVHEATAPAAYQQRVYQTISRIDDTGELVMKLVNVGQEPVELQIDVDGGADAYNVRQVVLTGAPEAENAPGRVPQAVPQDARLGRREARFLHQLPANSLTILRLEPLAGEGATGSATNGDGAAAAVSGGDAPDSVRQRRRRWARDPLRVHDPSTIVKEGDRFWCFATGFGVDRRWSHDLRQWQVAEPVFSPAPGWITEVAESQRGHFWAPDVVFRDNKYWLYYSVSAFGKRTSAIALATSPTLDDSNEDYQWTDEGIVIQTTEANDYNAIDPAIYQPSDGTLWMVFGSFWSGIKLMQLDPATGKRLGGADAPLHSLADKEQIEAAALLEHDGKHYLFVNWGHCCRGVNSTYEIRVGRSDGVEGPYVDKDGVDLLDGGGTPLVATRGSVIGPGHAAFVEHDGQQYMSYHYYDGDAEGRSRLAIAELMWDAQGWPQLGESLLP
ncbi:MAG: family 43 glycosylhydrolase, partial [Planctomycetales bacterium]|nr:family 43 glycosylhydrolase [Planctomycetales bacterium]